MSVRQISHMFVTLLSKNAFDWTTSRPQVVPVTHMSQIWHICDTNISYFSEKYGSLLNCRIWTSESIHSKRTHIQKTQRASELPPPLPYQTTWLRHRPSTRQSHRRRRDTTDATLCQDRHCRPVTIFGKWLWYREKIVFSASAVTAVRRVLRALY